MRSIEDVEKIVNFFFAITCLKLRYISWSSLRLNPVYNREKREKVILNFKMLLDVSPSWSFILRTGGFAKGVDAVRSVTWRRTVTVFMFCASCACRSAAAHKMKKKNKIKIITINKKRLLPFFGTEYPRKLDTHKLR